jgi:lipopolysaccharide/colanic/teichoic acid biosynthesis glycosyltransferase
VSDLGATVSRDRVGPSTGEGRPRWLGVLGRGLDVALALGALVLGAPFLALACALVKLEDGGPVLFRQARCGRDGRRFTLLKLRTMVPGAERYHALLAPLNEMKGPAFKMTRDPRVLRVGRWLRRFSIDEIPQLLNVLAGDMALVGPRPALPEEVTRYEPWQRRRLTVKPGLTGLSQVEGRGAQDFDTVVRLDLWYIDHWSPLLDLRILLRTVPAILRGHGAR